MSNIDKQALRNLAVAAKLAPSWYAVGEFGDVVDPAKPEWKPVHEFCKTFTAERVLALLDDLEAKDKLVKELKNQVDYLQKIAHEQNELATKASNENASLTVMHGRALKHIDSLEKDLVPVYQVIMNNHHKDGYIEWCDCNKQYFETVNEEQRRIVYSNIGVELQTVTPVTYFENDDAYQCRKWAWQQVKDEVTTEGWTSGDNVTYFGFFCWGWDMRRQYNEQRAVTVKLPKTMYTEFEDDDFCREVAVLEKNLVLDCLSVAGIKVEAE